jgi:RNA polymerase sigma factor (sigma-70 family)
VEGAGKDIVANVNAAPATHAHYEQLYRLHYPRVMRLCRLLLADAHEAEDVAQEVFIKLWQASQTETRAMAWEPWLTRVTVNACRDRRRSGWWKWWRAPRHTADGAFPAVLDCPSWGPTPEEDALTREGAARIWKAFRELPARQASIWPFIESVSNALFPSAEMGLSAAPDRLSDLDDLQVALAWEWSCEGPEALANWACDDDTVALLLGEL